MSTDPQISPESLKRRLAGQGISMPADEFELVAAGAEGARESSALIRGRPAGREQSRPVAAPESREFSAPSGSGPINFEPESDSKPDSEPLSSLTGAAQALRDRTVSSAELVEAAITQADQLDARVGVFVSRFQENARREAQRADAELAKGQDRGPLHGIPIGIKDLIATELGPTTAQSTVIDPGWGGGRDAAAVARLREAGAILVGTTTLSEFACGFADCDPRFAVPRNPWDLEAWAGGSSGGSAGGVATGMFHGALGTDTAGSIRIPAGYCGISGLKPTQGRVQRAGSFPLSDTLDCLGPMARTARDCAAMLDAIAPLDSPSLPDGAINLNGLRIGVDLREGGEGERDPAQPGLMRDALGVLAACGAELTEVELPVWPEVVTASSMILVIEAFAHHTAKLASHWSDYGRSTRLLLSTGAWYSAADYAAAQRVRRLAQHQLAALFERVDLVISPMSALGAPPLADLQFGAPGVGRMLGALFCDYWNAVDAPALSVPIGLGAEQMPLAMQIAGPAFAEATVLRAGAAFQERTPWHTLRPPLVRART